MTQQEKNEVAIVLANMATYFGKDITKPVISMMVEDLSDLNFQDVLNAFTAYRKNPKNISFPLPAKIREIINPTQSVDGMANEAASRIRKAIVDFGWCNPSQARAYIGELGWRIVERSGGWMYVCENHGVELNPLTFHAQARDLAKAIVESEGMGIGDMPIGLPEPIQNKKLQNVVSMLTGKNEFPK